MKLWIWFQNFVDIKSGAIVGLWSLGILSGSLLSIVDTHQVSAAIASCFCAVITGLAATNCAKHISNKNSTNGINNDSKL